MAYFTSTPAFLSWSAISRSECWGRGVLGWRPGRDPAGQAGLGGRRGLHHEERREGHHRAVARHDDDLLGVLHDEGRVVRRALLDRPGLDLAGCLTGQVETRPVKQGSADDAAFIMKNAEKVIIVPATGWMAYFTSTPAFLSWSAISRSECWACATAMP
jgi:hypothetical protein